MTTLIDDITLMPARSAVGTAPTRFAAYGDGERPKLLNDGQFSFLFVLQGELASVFRNACSTVAVLTASQMMVIDKHQLRELRCVGKTVILELVMSDKMASLMQSVSRAFNRPCSQRITIDSTLQAWCKTVFANLAKQPSRDNDYHHSQCCELTAILLQYPQSVLGALYVPLYACCRRCETCPKLFVRDK